MRQFKIVRLCALWDRAGDDKENIPTVIELIDNDLVIDTLADETRSHRTNEAMALLNPSVEQDLNAAERDAMRQYELALADEKTDQARKELRLAIRRTLLLSIAAARLDHEYAGQASGALARKDLARETWADRADEVRRRDRSARPVGADCRAALLSGEREKLFDCGRASDR
jgi:hypothetical protein